MDTILLIAILIGVLGAGALLAALFVATSRNSGGRESAELAARLAQMTEAQAAQQAQLALTLQAHERTLAKTVDERLQLLTGRIDATLEKTSTTQKTTLEALQ